MELFHTLLAGEQVRAMQAVYVQDMGQADWNQPKGHWIDAKTGLRAGQQAPRLHGADYRQLCARGGRHQVCCEYGGKVLRLATSSPTWWT